jgi:DNA-binding HxlR family transcriptional regulator
LKKVLSGISSTVLADRLLELEREGLVSKKIYPEVPPKVGYRLTTRAKELEVIIKELAKWAAGRHQGCKNLQLTKYQSHNR